MGYSSLAGKITDALLANGARGYVDQFNFPQGRADVPVHSVDCEAEAEQLIRISPQKVREIREFLEKTKKECDERLAREKVAVFKLEKLSGQKALLTFIGYMTKGEASKVVGEIFTGELLDLDHVSAGMFVRADHFFVSEATLAYGLSRFGSDLSLSDLVGRLIDERSAQRRAA